MCIMNLNRTLLILKINSIQCVLSKIIINKRINVQLNQTYLVFSFLTKPKRKQIPLILYGKWPDSLNINSKSVVVLQFDRLLHQQLSHPIVYSILIGFQTLINDNCFNLIVTQRK